MSKQRREKLREAVRNLLFEENWPTYPTEYMSHPADQETMIPPNLPVAPTDLMANRLAVERPPIEDEEFTPAGVEELSRAASALAAQVPQEEVEGFYSGMKKELEAAIERENNPETQEPTESQENTEAEEVELEDETGPARFPTQEARIARSMVNMIAEISDWSSPDPRYQKSKAKEEWEEELEAEELTGGKSGKDSLKGKYIAQYYQKAGPSGVNVTTDRLMKDYMRPMFDVGNEELNDVKDYLRFQFKEHAPELPDPQGAQQAFMGMIMKKVVRKVMKTNDSLDGNLLPGIVQYWKSLNDKKIKELITKAVDEDISEREDFEKLVQTLTDEEPEQLEVLQDLGLI
jgi:hypothetical protein